MIDDFYLRSAAVVAAIAYVAAPRLVAAAKSIAARASSPFSGKQEVVAAVDDAHTVVEIARRLRKAGNTKGADLCKQLLDVMLSSEGKA